MRGRMKRGIIYMTCPICFTGKVKQVDDGQFKCENCESIWTYTSDE